MISRTHPGHPVAAAAALTAAILFSLFAAGCAPHRTDAGNAHVAPSGAPSQAAAEQGPSGVSPAGTAAYRAPVAIAFATDARVLVEDAPSRKMKLRFYGQAPDRFRIEVRGSVGGIALVATGRAGRIRIVVPSRRRYAEGTMDEDLGVGLVGVPMTGCDLAMVVRISAGFKKFHPCGEADPFEDAPVTATDRPGLIVDTSPQGEELVRFGWDWSGDGPFPREMRVESLAPPQTSLALTSFKSLDEVPGAGEDFFWEPLPAGAVQVPIGDFAAGADR